MIEETFLNALRRFADSVTSKMSQMTRGEPEDQLRSPFEVFIQDAASGPNRNIVCTGETKLYDRIGKPDYAVHRNKLLAGYVELKAPNTGANPKHFTGHNREQWKRFQALPNLIYCDGNEWALYRNGILIDKMVVLSGDVTTEGKNAVTAEDARALSNLLTHFLSWEPFIPTDRKGKIDLKEFAGILAPLCRMLRDDVTDALKDSQSPLVKLAKDWRQLLFPNASDEQFADAYAQTVTFALLLGRSESRTTLTIDNAVATLAAHHSLLSRALQVLTDPGARVEISASLDMLLRVIAVVPVATLAGPEDPWLYFYEDFLAAYDPKLRKNVGAYYTPIEVVRAQVRLVDDLLTNRLGRPLGFADPGVVTLDPAAGTGTYLLGVIEHALKKVKANQGPGAAPGKATDLAKNIYGFEVMVGPFAVAELRVSRALRDSGASLPDEGPHIYLTDTLESPNVQPLELAYYLKPIADQHRRALEVKGKVPVIVCIGNPPYDRHEKATGDNKARTGGWVRWGDNGRIKDAILNDFLEPTIIAGPGVHIKNLYNLYIYFWRWALWKVFEHKTAAGPGVVSFISASSYLDGDAFCGMREYMRRLCDEIWIIDLGGEGRGPRKTDNVFAIQTPVAIAVAVRYDKAKKNKPASVHYVRLDCSRDAKLRALDAIKNFASIKWQKCPDDWQASFRPAGKGKYFSWPLLTDLFPWQHSGAKFHRTWPICNDQQTLKNRWRDLLVSKDRALAFKETRDRVISGSYVSLQNDRREKPINQLILNEQTPDIVRYAYRSFDRQWIFADSRLGDFLCPVMWQAHSERQIYFTTAFTQALSSGPSLTGCACIPDLHHFSGRGAKDIVALYRDDKGKEPNILPGILKILAEIYKRKVTPEDFAAYVYGVLAQPVYTKYFANELETHEIRVPITKNHELFTQVGKIGARLLWLHTYGERLVPRGKQRGEVPRGKARCEKDVPGDPDGYPESFRYNDAKMTLHVGEGEFQPVSREVFEFEVSGLKVVQSWLKYRMKKGAGRKSSPLDDIRPEHWTSEFTTELLELLWVLEATIESYPAQAALFDAVVNSPCFRADELPTVSDEARKPPKPARGLDLFDNMETE